MGAFIMALFACKRQCFVGALVRVGATVDETIADQCPDCFVRLNSKSYKNIQSEIEEKIPEIAEIRHHQIKPMSNREYIEAQNRVTIAGDKK